MKKYFLLFSLFVFLSCRKEGLVRRLEGVWDLHQFVIDNSDTTDAIKSQPCYVQWEFMEPDESSGDRRIHEYPRHTCPYTAGYDLKNMAGVAYALRLSNSLQSNFNAVGAYRDTARLGIYWSVRKLTPGDLIVETVHKGKKNYMHLKRVQ
jgi:hypothetical protein